jgi:hypothetical protein
MAMKIIVLLSIYDLYNDAVRNSGDELKGLWKEAIVT